jgi:predicted amidohydrolase YtcJ
MKILYNARIHTLDSANPQATALVIEQDRVLEVGETDQLNAAFSQAEKQDMAGRVILPGLIDAHLHLKQYALALRYVDCETDSKQECLARVKERVQVTRPGEWILGHGWNQNHWEGWPSATDLDDIAPHNPVYLSAKSLHAAWLNSSAMQLAGIQASTPDPANGQILHDVQGKPTGVVLESAMELAVRSMTAPSLNDIVQAIEQAQASLWSMGITGVHDFDRRTCFMALQRLCERDTLRLRVIKSIPFEDLQHAVELGLRTGFGNNWLRIGSVKAFMDGALGPRTAAMFEPYLNEPENRGILNMDAEQLFESGREAVMVGLSLAVHAIGDRANHEVLQAFEQIQRFEQERNLLPLRHRIEHVQVLHAKDAARLADMKIIASMQPIHATSDMHMADKYWGERAELAYAWQTQLQHGARLAFGSDAPVESPNPFLGIHAAVTRQRSDGTPGPQGWFPEQRLPIQKAIEAYTLGAAYAGGLEDRQGKLAPGYYADLIALDQDPFQVAPSELLGLKPGATMVGGEWVWQC